MSDTNLTMGELETQTDPAQDPPSESQETGSDQDPNAIDRQELETLRQVVEAQSRQLNTLTQGQVATLQAIQANAPAPVEEAPLPDKNDDPIGHLTALMERREKRLVDQLEQSIAPLRNMSAEASKKGVFDNHIADLKLRYPKIADEVFDEMWTLGKNGFDPSKATPQAFEAGLKYLLGEKAAQGISVLKQAKTTKQESQEEEESPIIPPRTPSNMPPRGDYKAPRKIVESDRRIMSRMSLDPKKPGDVQKYFDYLNSDVRVRN